MRRAIQVLMIATVVAQATGLMWLASEQACAAECDADGDADTGIRSRTSARA
jgi:hypothetical protein